jgi:ABC-type lipoprotein export system ATPase subunit
MTNALSIVSVSVCYWRGKRPVQVLRDASMVVDPGEVAGVWAKAGGGKTTLLEVAAGVLFPEEGRVVVAGYDLAELSARDLRAVLRDHIGLATRQGPQTTDLNVASWVELALLPRVGRRAAARQAREALERVGVGEVGEEPWCNLSNRERILASIARAMAGGPKLLLVDDPAAGLDMLESMEVLDLLRGFARATGVAVLVTASDMADLQGVESIWSLSDGYLMGPPREHAPVVDLAERAARR